MRKLVNSVLAGALCLSMIAGVTAQTASEDASINVEANSAGDFTAIIQQAPFFGSVDYSVTPTTVTTTPEGVGDLEIVVTYARGDALGWGVNISGEDFTNGDLTDPETFSVGSLTLGTSGVTASPGTPGNVTATSNYNMTGIPTNLLAGSLDVGSNGIFTVTYTSNELVVPAGTLVDEYTSTLTVEITDAP